MIALLNLDYDSTETETVKDLLDRFLGRFSIATL